VQIGTTQVPIRLDPAQVLADTIQPTETDAPGLTVGGTPGTFAVTPDGQASYVVDLFIPPGRITPNLKLLYGSGSGQSIFGVGWQLSGLSQITRCPHTIALDRGAVHVAGPEFLAEALGITPAGRLPCFVAAQIAVTSLAGLAAYLGAAGLPYRRVRLKAEGDAIAVTLPAAIGDTMLFHAA